MQIEKGADNRYWQYPLAKEGNISLIHKWASKIYWFAHVIAILLYSLFIFVYLEIVSISSSTKDKYAIKALNNLKHFIDIYPTSVYPLIVKSFELAIYSDYKVEEPSLDLGTGDGYFTNRLYGLNGSRITIASDLTGSTLLQSAKYDFYEKLAIIDASQTPIPSNSLNTVLMNNLIHHLPDRIEVLNEIYRILKPDGLFAFTDEFIGWATSQWYIGNNEKKLKKFLNQTIQDLLEDKQFWIDQLKGDWVISGMKEFFSNRSMYLASYLESLNHKIGSTTPEKIMAILDKFRFLKRMQVFLTIKIATMLIINDSKWCKEYGATSIFIALKKRGEYKNINRLELVCPECKGGLDDNCCQVCNKVYPIFKGIPFLISYFDKLPLSEYIENSDKQVREASC